MTEVIPAAAFDGLAERYDAQFTATALGAVLVSNDVAGWIVGLAVGLTSVVLAAVLWSSRQL